MKIAFRQSVERIHRIDRRLAAAGMFIFSAAVLGGMIYRQRNDLLNSHWSLTDINFASLILSMLVFSLDLFLVAWVWGLIMNSIGPRIPLTRHFAYFSVSNAAKRIPGTIWYIAGRGYLYNLQGISPAIITIASGMEFAIAIISVLLVSIGFALPLLFTVHIQAWSTILFLALCLVFIHPRVVRWLLMKFRVDGSISYRYSSLIVWILLYVIAWIVGGLVLYLVVGAFRPITIDQLPFVIGCWSLTALVSSAFFFFPSNLGVTEVTLSLLLSKIMPSADAVIIAILMRLMLTAFELLWAVISALLLQKWGVKIWSKPNPAAVQVPDMPEEEK